VKDKKIYQFQRTSENISRALGINCLALLRRQEAFWICSLQQKRNYLWNHLGFHLFGFIVAELLSFPARISGTRSPAPPIKTRHSP
jgi:hypothetical protein